MLSPIVPTVNFQNGAPPAPPDPAPVASSTPPPTGNAHVLNDGTQLDGGVVKVMRAIRKVETNGDYENRTGDNGSSAGAYQWNNDNRPLAPGETPSHWKTAAQEFIGDPNAPMTRENQNYVAYHQIKKYKDQGLTPIEIDALWNGAHKDANGRYVHNAPERLTKFQQALAQEAGNGYPQAVTGGAPQQMPGMPYLASAAGDNAPETPQSGGQPDAGNPVINTIKGVGDFLLPSIGDAYHAIKGDNTKTALQNLGDLGTSALTVASLIPGLGEGAMAAKAGLAGTEGIGLGVNGMKGVMGATQAVQGANKVGLLGKAAGLMAEHPIAGNATLGGAFGVTNALGQGETDPTKIAGSGAIGAVTGGVLGKAGTLISKATDVLPTRLVQGVLKNSNPDIAEYALTKSMGTPSKMLAESDASLKKIGSDLGAELTNSKIADVVVPSGTILPEIQSQFKGVDMTPERLQSELMKIAPLQENLIKKLFAGDGLTIDELHTLNSEVGKNTYKMAFDDPTVKAGKQIGNAFYQTSKKIITGVAPDTAPLFDQYSKEIALNTALSKLGKRESKKQILTLRDIISMVGGYSALGPAGAAGAYAMEKAATSPTVNLKFAGLLNQAADKNLTRFIPPATVGATGLLNQAVNNR